MMLMCQQPVSIVDRPEASNLAHNDWHGEKKPITIDAVHHEMKRELVGATPRQEFDVVHWMVVLVHFAMQ